MVRKLRLRRGRRRSDEVSSRLWNCYCGSELMLAMSPFPKEKASALGKCEPRLPYRYPVHGNFDNKFLFTGTSMRNSSILLEFEIVLRPE